MQKGTGEGLLSRVVLTSRCLANSDHSKYIGDDVDYG